MSKNQDSEKSYEQTVIEKLGNFETFNDYEKNYEIDNNMVVLKYDKSFFYEKDDKGKREGE